MKRKLYAVLLLMCMLLVHAGAENELTEEFASALGSLYGEGTVISAAECGNSGAAVIRTENGCILSVLSRNEDRWTVEFENPHAAGEESSVYLDTDEMLILTDPFPGSRQQYYFTRGEEWTLSFAVLYDSCADEWNMYREYCASLSDGWLCRETLYTDENDNVLARFPGMTLPDVLTEQEKKLESFSGFEPPFNGMGYPADDSMSVSDDILFRLFGAAVSGGYRYVDGNLDRDGLQFIADRQDGARVLLCCEYAPDHSCRITESAPLPAETRFGIENFTTTLNLGKSQSGVSIGRNSDGTWGAKGALTKDGSWFAPGTCYVSDGGLWWNSTPYIGTVTWNDITDMDWLSLPESLEAAKAAVDPSAWATPRNPDAADRLHLRAQPDRNSRSLGKYYNGTPLRVISRGAEWTRVRVGNTEGYMMTKYLAFGEQINRLPSALTGKVAVHPVTEILWEGEESPDLITGSEAASMLIVGVNEEWYLMWDPYTDRFGRIRQSDLWDGNG